MNFIIINLFLILSLFTFSSVVIADEPTLAEARDGVVFTNTDQVRVRMKAPFLDSPVSGSSSGNCPVDQIKSMYKKDERIEEISVYDCSTFNEYYILRELNRDVSVVDIQSCCGIMVKDEDYIQDILITFKNNFVKKEQYLFSNSGVASKQWNKIISYSSRELDISINERLSNELKIKHSIPLVATKEQYEIEILEKGQEEGKGRVAKVLTLSPSSRTVDVVIDQRIKNGETINISSIDGMGEISGKEKYKPSKPKSEKDATSYLSLALERDSKLDQKSVLSVNVKYDNSKGKALSAEPDKWGSLTGIVNIDYDNKEKKSEKKATLKLVKSKYSFSKFGNLNKDGVYAPNTDRTMVLKQFGLGLEYQENMKNRNILLSHLNSYETPKFLRNPNFIPFLGFDIGKNFGLTSKIDPDDTFQDYDIIRGIAGFSFSYLNEIDGDYIIDSISYNFSNNTRYLFTDEVHIRTLKGAGMDGEDIDETFFDKGINFFWEAEMIFNLNKRTGISLKFKNGQEPPFYREEDKLSLNFIYSY